MTQQSVGIRKMRIHLDGSLEEFDGYIMFLLQTETVPCGTPCLQVNSEVIVQAISHLARCYANQTVRYSTHRNAQFQSFIFLFSFFVSRLKLPFSKLCSWTKMQHILAELTLILNLWIKAQCLLLAFVFLSNRLVWEFRILTSGLHTSLTQYKHPCMV